MSNFFPNNTKFAWSSKLSQKYNTVVQRSASGMTRTMCSQLMPLWVIEASYPALTDEEEAELQGFVALIKGSYEPFFWLDPDRQQAKNFALAKINDTQYQAVMKIGGYVEPVEYIDNVTVYVNGTKVSNYSVDGGIIKFNGTPTGTVTADYRYYWKMIFTEDGITTEKIFKNINRATFSMEIVR